MAALPPAPSGQALHLISALSNTQNHELHVQAIRARDEALSASVESYGNLCLQLSYVMVGASQPEQMVKRIDPAELEAWRQSDTEFVTKLQQDEKLWIPFGQMAGLVLKNALLRPPILANHRPLSLQPPASDHVKEMLLYALGCQHAELRAVASSVIATTAVSPDGVQPALYIKNWPQLVPTLIANLKTDKPALVEGSLATIRKMLEDGPNEIDQEELDNLVPVLIRFLASDNERSKVSALQSLVSCISDNVMPSAMVLHFNDYLGGLSTLATDPSPSVRKWVCRNIVTLLEQRTEYIQPHLQAVCQFMLNSSADKKHDSVALEACEFWLAFANLDEGSCTTEMFETVGTILPQLIPTLLHNMVYLPEQQIELQTQNEVDQEEGHSDAQAMRPVFHRSRARQVSGGEESDSEGGYEEDDEDANDYDDEDGNEWTLRKCSAASLDSLSNIYGAEPILPCLLPVLQEGLSSKDPWVQEASILALGAIAEGCREEMHVHMGQLHPYLMNHLVAAETPTTLPQVKSIAAWTISRYTPWVVDQVQTGAQGHLLAQMTEIFLARLSDRNRKVQVACCSAFGVMIETAGDLMAPYLEHVYRALVTALSRYQGRSLLMLFDVFGIMADNCGPSIAEANLPAIYVPPLLHMWNEFAKNDTSDKRLLPLMESLASIAVTCEMNYQPYALESFENAMAIIESVQLELTSLNEKLENEEDADPIICATDLLDGLVEGLRSSFPTLVSSSQRYGPHFLSVLHTMCKHDSSGVRMSALALLGDLARNAPKILEPALPEFIKETISNMDPVDPSVCTNAVWAMGEICAKCEGHSALLESFVPSLMQNLISLLMGNGIGASGRGVEIPGLPENAAACVGRLAKVNPSFVAPDLSRFLLGWCDGMAKIMDPTERRDAYQGFVKAVYANPQAIHHAAASVRDAIASILFAIVSWHMPPQLPDESTVLLSGDYNFQPFPPSEAELGSALAKLIQEMKTSVGEETWHLVEKDLPLNVRRLLRETYYV